jgi:hypothetical protein
VLSRKTEMYFDDDLIQRPYRAYSRRNPQADLPPNSSTVESHAGRDYVVLRNVSGILAVYRIRNDESLRPLTRWPAALEACH